MAIICHTADHGCRVPLVNRYYVNLSFNSTLEGSVLILTCQNEKLMHTTDKCKQTLEVICLSNTTSWNPDPTDFIESCSISSFTTPLPGTK